MIEPLPERRRYYNPVLDPHVVASKMTDKMRATAPRYAGGPLNDPDDDHPANLVSSLCTDGKHRPALDIDVPVEVVPSSTPGHHHLYFPTITLTWGRYATLLGNLAEVGIIESAYHLASLSRHQSLLRPPGVLRAIPRQGHEPW